MSVTSPKAPRATAWKRKFIDSFQNDAAIEPVPLPRSATPPSPKGTTPANQQQASPLLKGSASLKQKASPLPKGTTLANQQQASPLLKGSASLKQKASPSPKGTTPANQQQAVPLLKGSVSPKEKATSASKGTTLPKQRSSLAAGERLSFKLAPQAQPCRASAVTSASASSAAAVAADSGAGSPAGATGSVFAKTGKFSSPGAGKSGLTSSPGAGKSAPTSSPDAGKPSPTSSPKATQLSAAAKFDSAKRGTDASLRQTQSGPFSQAGATEPVAAQGSDKAKVTTAAAAAAQPAVVSSLSIPSEVPSVAAAVNVIAPSATHPSKLPAKFRISLTDTAAASQSDLPDSASVCARVYSPQAEAATQLPQAGLGSIKGKTVAQVEGSAKGSVEVEEERLADAAPLPEDEGPAVPLPPLPTAASAAAEQAAASAVSLAAAAAPAAAAVAAQAPPLPAAAGGAASAAPAAADQAAPAAFPSASHPSAEQAQQPDPPSLQLPPTLGLAAKRDTGATAMHRVPAPVHGQPGPSDPRLARKRQREESRSDMLQQASMPRKISPSLLPEGLPSRLLPQLPGQLLGVTKPGQPAARSSSSSQQSQRDPDRDERTPTGTTVESDSAAATHSASLAAASLTQGRAVSGAALPGSDPPEPSNPAGPAPTQSHPWGMAEPSRPPPLPWRNAKLGPSPPPSWGSAGPAPLLPRPWGHPRGNPPPPFGPVGNAGLLHHSHRNSSYSRPGSASKSSRWDVSTPKQGSPAPTPSRPLSAPTGLPPQPGLPIHAAAAAAVPSYGSNRRGAVAYPAQQQQGSAAVSGPFSPQFGSGNSQQAASEQGAAEWHVRNPEVSHDCQAKVVQLRYRWGKSHGEDSAVKGLLSMKARVWSAKRMGRLASESGILSCLVMRHDRTTVPALASLHFSLACLALNFNQAFQPASAFAL